MWDTPTADVPAPPAPATGVAALHELRRARQRRRLGDVEWYDVAYRAYLYGFGGLIAVVVASDSIGTLIDDDVDPALVVARAPAILGVLVAVVVAVALRSGTAGGPISIEAPDVRHVLLAPIPRRRVLLRPASQRLRSAAFVAALVAGVIGQLVGRELAGSRGSWAVSCALFGALTASLFVSTALIAHATRLPNWAATVIGVTLVAWQSAAAFATWNESSSDASRSGPFTLFGSVALWGIRQRPVDWIAIVATVGLVISAAALVGRLRLEPLTRRAALVTQLRFAATVQDLRTVVLLRRQLRAESLRSRPWGWARRAVGESDSSSASFPPARHRNATFGVITRQAVWRRSVASLRRLPAARVGRIVALSAIGGVAAALSVTATPLFAVALLVPLLLVGLEVLEPLSQEVDHPDRTDALPVARGALYAHLLAGPAVLLAVVGLVGATSATVVEPSGAGIAFILGIPVALAGAIGAVATTVRDAPRPVGAAASATVGSDLSLVPPEFAGFNLVVKALLPLVLTAVGVGPVVATAVHPTVATAVRGAIAAVLAVAFTVVWVIRRDRWSIQLHDFFEQGRQARASA